jgi:hypothetical protein
VKWRWKRSSSGFSTITLPDGNKVLADDETRRFFEDTDRPDPSNESLSRLWREVARVRIIDGGVSEAKPLGHTVLLDETNAEYLAQLFERLAIVEPALGIHCMCYGDQALELRDHGDTVLAVLGLHDGASLRWDGWSTDAELKDGQALLDWLGRQDVHLPNSDGWQQGTEEASARLSWGLLTDWSRCPGTPFQSDLSAMPLFWSWVQMTDVITPEFLIPRTVHIALGHPNRTRPALGSW